MNNIFYTLSNKCNFVLYSVKSKAREYWLTTEGKIMVYTNKTFKIQVAFLVVSDNGIMTSIIYFHYKRHMKETCSLNNIYFNNNIAN